MEPKQILKTHTTVNGYAKIKSVYPSSVHSAIKKGKIVPDLVGLDKVVMISLKKYGDYKFDESKRHIKDKDNIEKWFKTKGKVKRVTNWELLKLQDLLTRIKKRK